ncbi:MAG: cation transporter [Flavobacteriaceae bacterium]|jgi:Cu+-exporting ATPase|nr:cation transporter [Flavobacteriaceae bacterium]
MKIGKIVLLAVMGVTLMTSCKKDNKDNSTLETVAEVTPMSDSKEVAGKVEKATFQIEGMTCAMGCAKMIEGKLSGLDGVKEAKVDFDSKTATVEFDDAKQNGESIKKTVEKIAQGMYKVENLTIGDVAKTE